MPGARLEQKLLKGTFEMSKRLIKLTKAKLRQCEEGEPDRPRAAGDRPAERRCMSCGEIFLSEGWHNRLCNRCGKRGQSQGNYAAHGF